MSGSIGWVQEVSSFFRWYFLFYSRSGKGEAKEYDMGRYEFKGDDICLLYTTEYLALQIKYFMKVEIRGLRVERTELSI